MVVGGEGEGERGVKNSRERQRGSVGDLLEAGGTQVMGYGHLLLLYFSLNRRLPRVIPVVALDSGHLLFSLRWLACAPFRALHILILPN